MTTSTTEATKTTQVVVTNAEFPLNLRPTETRHQDFWSGSEEGRTFFAVANEPGDLPFLVLAKDDQRGLGMRTPLHGDEMKALRERGLDPEGHVIWSIHPEHFVIQGSYHEVPSTEPVVAEPTIENLAAERAEFEAQVARLTEENAALSRRLDAAREEARAARQRHEADIERVSDHLIEEAESRSWCSEYDRVVNEINEGMNVPLRQREREFSVTLDVTVRITRTVTAIDADAAGEIASEGIDSEDIRYGEIEDTEVYETEEN